jgi:hypothetical protein
MSNIIKQKYIGYGVTAYQYVNGIIWIDGNKYLLHSFTSAIAAYRKRKKQIKEKRKLINN